MLTLLFAGLLSLTRPASPPAPLPAWAQTYWATAGLGKTFDRKLYAQPGFLQADFNGDGKTDVAVLVARRTTGSRGLIILHQGLAQHHVLGNGPNTHRETIHGDFSWVDHWRIYTKPTTDEVTFEASGGILGSRVVKLRHPTIEITQEEVGGGMIYWNGQRYTWIHQSC
jgi:hypothetical protein